MQPLSDDAWNLVDVITPNQTEAPILLGIMGADAELAHALRDRASGLVLQIRTRRGRGGMAAKDFVERESYFDKTGMENNRKLGITYSDDDLLQYIRNIYGVLLTRGMLGTYVYVCDPALRERLRESLSS